MSIILGLDPETLHERVDLLAAGRRLDELGAMRSLSALTEKVTLLRLVGRLDEALDTANAAVRLARFTGDRAELLAVRIRHAQVLQSRGSLEEAVVELTTCVNEAHAHTWDELEALAVQQRGRARFDEGDFTTALGDLTAALFLREKIGSGHEELEDVLVAITTVEDSMARGSAAESAHSVAAPAPLGMRTEPLRMRQAETEDLSAAARGHGSVSTGADENDASLRDAAEPPI